MTAPLDLAALRGLLARRAAQWAHTDPDAFHEMDTKIATALPALLDFAAEAERVVRAAGQLVSDLIDCNPSDLGPILTATWEAWRAQQERLLARLAGNGEAR